jgi:secreted trypsin-like serine protease
MDFKQLVTTIVMALVLSNATYAADFSSITPRIIGGTPVAEGAPYSWMVSIQGRDSGGWFHYCGGTLIAADWVVTAAHCVENTNMVNDRLVIGAVDISNPAQGEVREIDWYSVHQDYDSDLFYSDVAIIHLTESSNQIAVDLITKDDMVLLAEGEQLQLMGWGLTIEDDNSSVASQLQETPITFRSDTKCTATHGAPEINNDSELYWSKTICAGEDTPDLSDGLYNDACQGDSGGPLLWNDAGTLKLTGIVSWGKGCGKASSYGGYAEVAQFLDWLDERQEGLSLVGFNKIGFLGYGRKKGESYRLINKGNASKTIMSAHVTSSQENTFEIEDGILNSTIAANSEVTFNINAVGSYLGEHDAVLVFNTGEGEVDFGTSLNSKVLYDLETDSLGVAWDFYSGTNENTEHAEPWFEVEDSVKGTVLRSGAIDNEERSVLLTYINGPSSGDLFLKFDSRVDAESGFDYLLITINETQSYKITANSWHSTVIELPYEVNRVQYIYIKDAETSEGEDAAYLSNLRICTDLNDANTNESTCSQLEAFNNVDTSAQKLETSIGTIGSVGNAILVDDDTVEGDALILGRKSSGGAIGLEWLTLMMLFIMPGWRRSRIKFFGVKSHSLKRKGS